MVKCYCNMFLESCFATHSGSVFSTQNNFVNCWDNKSSTKGSCI